MRASEMRPDSTASSRPAIAASGTGGINSTSAPASTARTAASPGGIEDRDAAHVHRVGDDQSAKFHFVAQQAGQNFWRKRGGDVSGSGSSAGTARWPGMIEPTPAAIAARKGTSSVLLQLFAIAGNHWQRKMRIDAHVAVARKMFGRRERAIFLDAANELRDELGDAFADLRRTSEC